MFGLTIKSLGNQSTIAALSRLGLDRILAETDLLFQERQGVLGLSTFLK